VSLNQQAVANGRTIDDLKLVLVRMLETFPAYDWTGANKLAFEVDCIKWLTENCVIG
jgi:hypothetical protein